jgi:thiol-disulfide isomerase/thioredoxin
MYSLVAMVVRYFMLGLVLVACGSKGEESARSGGTPAPQSGSEQTRPSVMAFSARDINGVVRSSEDWVGRQPIVINFWGTWCGPCRREMPDLVRLYDEYEAKGVEIIGLALNDTPAKVRAFADQFDMRWVLLMGDREIATRFFIQGVPTTIFVDRQGRVVKRHRGIKDYNTLKQSFEAIL